MPLTHDEMTDLDKMLARMEKNAKAWVFMRWLCLACGVGLLGMGAWLWQQQTKAWSGLTPDDNGPVDALDLMLANILLMHCFVCYVLALTHAGLGGCVVAGTLARWRKGKRDRLLVKMARSWMESQRPALP